MANPVEVIEAVMAHCLAAGCTQRQQQAVLLQLQGRTQQESAAELGIAQATVWGHLVAARDRLEKYLPECGREWQNVISHLVQGDVEEWHQAAGEYRWRRPALQHGHISHRQALRLESAGYRRARLQEVPS